MMLARPDTTLAVVLVVVVAVGGAMSSLADDADPATAAAASVPLADEGDLRGALSPSKQSAALVEAIASRLRTVSSQLALAQAAQQRTGEAGDDRALRGVWDAIKQILDLIVDFARILMDPAPLGDHDLSFDDDMLKGNLSLKGLTVSHLHEVALDHYGVDVFRMCATADVRLPRVGVVADYDVDLTASMGEGPDDAQRIFGAGPAKIDLWNITVHTKVCVSVWRLTIHVTELRLAVLKDLVDLQNLFGGGAISDLINGIVTDALPMVLEEYQTLITESIIKFINDFIKQHRLP